jgi:hypothetical protein
MDLIHPASRFLRWEGSGLEYRFGVPGLGGAALVLALAGGRAGFGDALGLDDREDTESQERRTGIGVVHNHERLHRRRRI